MCRGLGREGQSPESRGYARHSARRSYLLLFKTPRQPLSGVFFISLLQMRVLRPREREAVGQFTLLVRERAKIRIRLLCPQQPYFFFWLHQTTFGTQRGFALRTEEGTLQPSAWPQGDRSPGVSKPLPHFGVKPKVYLMLKLPWLPRLLVTHWTASISQTSQTDKDKAVV